MFEQGDDLGNISPEPSIEPLAEESSNRTFLVVASIMGAIVLLSIICMAVYALVIAPKQQAEQIARATELAAQNLLMQSAMTQTAEVAQWTATPSPKPAASPMAASATPTWTPVVALASPMPTSTLSPLELLVLHATQTALALTPRTVTVTVTPSALAGTGFADEFGLPGLLIIAVALVIVILLSRRLRAAPVR